MSGAGMDNRQNVAPGADASSEIAVLSRLQARHITAGLLTMTASGSDSISVEQYQEAQKVANTIVSRADSWKKELGCYHNEFEQHFKQRNFSFTSHSDKLYATLGAAALGQVTSDPELIAGSARFFGHFLAGVIFSDKNAGIFKQQDFERQVEFFLYHDNSINELPNKSIRETYTGVLNGSLSFGQ